MKQIAKKITLGILVISVLLGMIMLFIPSIPMDRFMTYVKAVAYLYTPLIASIGINSAIKKNKNNSDKQ